MKTTGAVWKEYLASWPEGQWYDDCDETINGISVDDFNGAEIPDDALVDFSTGVVFRNQDDTDGVSLTSHFRAWLKARDSITLVVQVPKGQEEALRAAVKGMKGNVR